MAGLSALLAQSGPQQAPPEQQGSASGAEAAGSLSSLLQQQGGGQAPAAPQPAPTYQQMVATIRHLGEFGRRFQELLADPDIGKKNMSGPIMEMMSDVMGEGFVTLPQVMSQLKTLPDDPLGQRQWLQKHLDNTMMVMEALLAQHAQAKPRVGPWDAEAALAGAGSAGGDHQSMINGVVNHYKSLGKKR